MYIILQKGHVVISKFDNTKLTFTAVMYDNIYCLLEPVDTCKTILISKVEDVVDIVHQRNYPSKTFLNESYVCSVAH